MIHAKHYTAPNCSLIILALKVLPISRMTLIAWNIMGEVILAGLILDFA